MSASKSWREEGNEFYQHASSSGLCPVLVTSRLQKSLNAYLRAEQCAISPDERASADKNYAMASWKLAHSLTKQNKGVRVVQNSLIDGFKYHAQAVKYGVDKPRKWHEGLKDAMERWTDFAIQYYINGTTGTARARLLEELGNVLLDHKLKGQCYLHMAQALFFKAVESMQNGDFRTSLSLTKDCYFPIEESSRLLKDKHSVSEINILREDVFLQMCSAESMQARVTGDDLLNKLLMEEEDLSMTLVYLTMDWYTNAVVLTRDKEIELEATALSRMGRLYADVLKMKWRAKEYYLKTIELALTLVPRSPEKEEWFKEAKAFIEACRKEEEEKEKSKWENIRKKHIGSLRESIKKIGQMEEKGYEELLRFIYKTHPPKNKAHQILDAKSPWDNNTVKKALMKALTHYHPDKIDLEEHGGKWKVLCEEITKILNRNYELHTCAV